MGKDMTTERGLRFGAIDAIAERLSFQDDLYLPYSAFASREETVTQQDKKQHLVELLNRDSAIFLERYGTSLYISELDEFDPLKENYEVNWHLKRLKAKLDPTPLDRKNKAAEVRNRRLAYMENLVNDGKYFSEEEMRMRSPLLHHEYLGQFQDPTTRGIAQPGEKFADLLGRQVDEVFIQQKLMEERKEAGIPVESYIPRDVEEQDEEEEDYEEDESDEEMDVAEGKNLSKKDVTMETAGPKTETETRLTSSSDPKLVEFSRQMERQFVSGDDENKQTEISEEEMKEKLVDFTKAMQERFLNGGDGDHVNYAKIDSDVTLDDHWLKQMSQDAEAKYFEED